MLVIAFVLAALAFSCAAYGKHNYNKLQNYPREGAGYARGYRTMARRRKRRLAVSSAVGLVLAVIAAYLLVTS